MKLGNTSKVLNVHMYIRGCKMLIIKHACYNCKKMAKKGKCIARLAGRKGAC